MRTSSGFRIGHRKWTKGRGRFRGTFTPAGPAFLDSTDALAINTCLAHVPCVFSSENDHNVTCIDFFDLSIA